MFFRRRGCASHSACGTHRVTTRGQYRAAARAAAKSAAPAAVAASASAAAVSPSVVGLRVGGSTMPPTACAGPQSHIRSLCTACNIVQPRKAGFDSLGYSKIFKILTKSQTTRPKSAPVCKSEYVGAACASAKTKRRSCFATPTHRPGLLRCQRRRTGGPTDAGSRGVLRNVPGEMSRFGRSSG